MQVDWVHGLATMEITAPATTTASAMEVPVPATTISRVLCVSGEGWPLSWLQGIVIKRVANDYGFLYPYVPEKVI